MDSIGTRSKSLPKTIWKRSHSRSFHHYAATRKKLFFGRPLYPPQGAEVTLVRLPNSSSAKSAFWNTSTCRMALVLWLQSRRVFHDEPQPRNIGRNSGTPRCNSASSLKHDPSVMNNYSAIILKRCDQNGGIWLHLSRRAFITPRWFVMSANPSVCGR